MLIPALRLAEPGGASYASAVNAFVDFLHTECGSAAHTITAYTSDLARFAVTLSIHDIDGFPIARLNQELLETWVSREAAEGLAPATRRRHVATVRLFLRFAHQERMLPDDLGDRLIVPKEIESLPRVLQPDEIARILDFEGDTAIDWRDRALLHLLIATGGRISEIIRLRWSDIDVAAAEANTVGKGDRDRVLLLAPVTLDVLKTLRALSPPKSQVVLAGRGGRPITRQTGWRIVAQRAKWAGVRGTVSPHAFRHTLATRLLESGAGIRTVQEILGHARVTTTQRYVHVSPERLRRLHQQYHPRAGA
jgi:integrase/recombinase XerD